MEEDYPQPEPAPTGDRGGSGRGRWPSRFVAGGSPSELVKGTIISKRSDGLFTVKLDSGIEIACGQSLDFRERQRCVKLRPGSRVTLSLYSGTTIQGFILKRVA